MCQKALRRSVDTDGFEETMRRRRTYHMDKVRNLLPDGMVHLPRLIHTWVAIPNWVACAEACATAILAFV